MLVKYIVDANGTILRATHTAQVHRTLALNFILFFIFLQNCSTLLLFYIDRYTHRMLFGHIHNVHSLKQLLTVLSKWRVRYPPRSDLHFKDRIDRGE